MKAEYINSFYKATLDVFKLMLDIEPKRGDLKLVENKAQFKDANVLLGVTGDLKGSILFSFPKDMALEMIKIMSGMDMDKFDNFATSALGEVANIIGGNALTNLSQSNYTCDIVPPKFSLGTKENLSIDNDKALLLPLMTKIGDFDISLSLKEN